NHAAGSGYVEIDARAAHGRVAQAQRGYLRLRLQIHAGAMPHQRSRVQSQQGTGRGHRERSSEIALQGCAGKYQRAGFIRAIRPSRSAEATQPQIEPAKNWAQRPRISSATARRDAELTPFAVIIP